MPEPDAVDQVRARAPDQQAERDRQHRVPRPRTGEEDQHPTDCERRQGGDERRGARKQAESDSGVLDVVDRERAEDMQRFVERELARDDQLRELVGRERGQDDCAKPCPLRPPRGERALRRRERRERVGTRADADVDRPRWFAHPRSSFRLQSMHCVV